MSAVAVNAFHGFIEKLVEVDVTFIILHKIHSYDLFHDSFSLHVLHTKWFLHVKKEIDQVGIFHLPTMLVSSVLCPVWSEYLKILFEYLKDILFWKIVEIELLQDNEDEEIEHDNRTDHVKRDKEDRWVPLSTVLPRNATWFFTHVVKHEPVPVLASWALNDCEHGSTKVIEVGVLWDDFAFCHIIKKKHTKNCKNEEEKH